MLEAIEWNMPETCLQFNGAKEWSIVYLRLYVTDEIAYENSYPPIRGALYPHYLMLCLHLNDQITWCIRIK